MKFISLLFAISIGLATSCAAKEKSADFQVLVKEGDDLMALPKVTAVLGKKFKIEVTRNFQDGEYKLPVGVIFEGKTELNEADTSFSFHITIRELKEKKVIGLQRVSEFESREYILNGLIRYKAPINFDLKDGTNIQVVMSPSTNEG